MSENNDAALGRAIRDLVLDTKRRETMSQFGRQRFREVLAWENSEQRLIAAYRQLFDRRVSRSTVNPTAKESLTADEPSA